MAEQSLVWDGDNLEEIARLFYGFMVLIEKSGDTLRISGPNGMVREVEKGTVIYVDEASGRVGFGTFVPEEDIEMVVVECANCQKPLEYPLTAVQNADIVVCSEICLTAIANRNLVQVNRDEH